MQFVVSELAQLTQRLLVSNYIWLHTIHIQLRITNITQINILNQLHTQLLDVINENIPITIRCCHYHY